MSGGMMLMRSDELFQVMIWKNNSRSGLFTGFMDDPKEMMCLGQIWFRRRPHQSYLMNIYLPDMYSAGLRILAPSCHCRKVVFQWSITGESNVSCYVLLDLSPSWYSTRPWRATRVAKMNLKQTLQWAGRSKKFGSSIATPKPSTCCRRPCLKQSNLPTLPL